MKNNTEKEVRESVYNENQDVILFSIRTFRLTNNKWKEDIPAFKKTYTYVYDEQKNWIVRISNINSIPESIEKRTITYW